MVLKSHIIDTTIQIINDLVLNLKRTMSKEIKKIQLISNEIKTLIEESKNKVALVVNSEITLLYWNIGKRIREEVLTNKRATYEKEIISSLAKQL